MQFTKILLSCSVVAAAGLLVAPAVLAAAVPTTCTTPGDEWTVTLMSGPTVMSSCTWPTPSGGPCVTATYKVEGSLVPDHVVGLMPLELFKVTGTNVQGNQADYDPGQGEPIFGLGESDVSRKAFKVNPNENVSYYTVWLDGTSFSLGRVPVKIKKGSRGQAIEGACALAGPAVTDGTSIYATFTEERTDTVLGGKCTVVAKTHPVTGVTTVTLTQGSINRGCTLQKIEAGDAEFTVNGEGGPVLYSEGVSVTVGTGTCTLKQYYEPWGAFYWICR